MSEDTKSLNAMQKPQPKAENVAEANDATTGPVELTAMVESLLNELQEKFTEHSKKILGKLNDMSARIDDLEKSLEKVLAQEESNDSTKQ